MGRTMLCLLMCIRPPTCVFAGKPPFQWPASKVRAMRIGVRQTADCNSDQERPAHTNRSRKVQGAPRSKGLAGFRESIFVFLVDEPFETFRISWHL